MTSERQTLYPPKLGRILKRALEDPENFWAEAADQLHWFKRWDKVFEWNYPTFKWFIGGVTNLTYNCLDRHVKRGRGDRPAIIWESAETGQSHTLTYNELLYEVRRLAAALKSMGLERGDRLTIYMPMVPEAAIGMLAAARIGAIHSVVFGGFGSSALADRINNAGSKLVLTADLGYRRSKEIKLKEILDESLKSVTTVQKVIVLKRGRGDVPMKNGRDIYWDEALNQGEETLAENELMHSDEYAFILHTSGTTAKPKGTVQPHGSYQVYIHSMGKWVFDMHEDDVWWSTSDIGWIVGHSYVVYAPLLIGCSTIMYEGVPDYPTPDVWWGIVEKYHVDRLFFSPTGVRALMRYGDEWPKKHDLSSVKLVVCAGEVLNPPAWEWLQKSVLDDKVPVLDHMWQTESGGPMVGNPYGISTLPIKPGSATIPLPGIDADIVDNDGKSLPVGMKGNFVIRRPFPGLLTTLWRDEARYVQDYWQKIPGCYYTGDAALMDKDGYVWFVGRADEVIKIASHRIGTIEIESVIVSHPAVTEAAVVGKPDSIKGEVGSAFVVLKPNFTPTQGLGQEIRELIRRSLGSVVVVNDVTFVGMIPKTRSGKIMRRLIKAVVTDQPLGDYSTIEDEASVDEVRKGAEALKFQMHRFNS